MAESDPNQRDQTVASSDLIDTREMLIGWRSRYLDAILRLRAPWTFPAILVAVAVIAAICVWADGWLT